MPFCAHHRAKKAEVWCDKDSVAVCMLCVVTGPHEDHPTLTIEEANERAHEKARGELAKLEAVIGEVDAALKHNEEVAAVEEESECQAAADMRQHFDWLREAVAQREKELQDELGQLKCVRIEAVHRGQEDTGGSRETGPEGHIS